MTNEKEVKKGKDKGFVSERGKCRKVMLRNNEDGGERDEWRDEFQVGLVEGNN